MGRVERNQVVLALSANRPRSALRNLDSLPLFRISRIIAAYKVAAGVLPLVDHQPLASITSTISLHPIGRFPSASARAAASRALVGFALCLAARVVGFRAALGLDVAFLLADGDALRRVRVFKCARAIAP